MVSGPALRALGRILDLAVHEVSSTIAGPAQDLEETLVHLGMVPVLEDGPVISAAAGAQPDQMLSQIGAALAAAPGWPDAGPPGVPWPPSARGLPGSLDAALAERPAAVAGGFAAGILSGAHCRALLQRAAVAVRPLDTAGWTARQRIAAAAVILLALGVIGPADGSGTMKDGDLVQALPVILALAVLIASPPGTSLAGW